jgi:hypothetical protein
MRVSGAAVHPAVATGLHWHVCGSPPRKEEEGTNKNTKKMRWRCRKRIRRGGGDDVGVGER